MCDTSQPKPKSGPTLCEAGQELVVIRVVEGLRNAEIRALLKKEGHYHDLSDQAFTHYRKLPIVKEARQAALASVRDVGILALSRRLDRMERRGTRLFDKMDGCEGKRPLKLDPAEEGNLTRAVVAVCKEISRLVDLLDPDGIDGIPNNGAEAAPVSVEQVLTAVRALTIRKRQEKAAAADAVQSSDISELAGESPA